MQKKFVITVLGCVCLVGCRTAYNQRPQSFVGRLFSNTGYSEKQIDTDTYIVSYVSKHLSSEQGNLRRAMYRAAELALQNQYPYFKVIQSTGGVGHYNYPTVHLTVRYYQECPDDEAINAKNYLAYNQFSSISDYE